MISKKDTQRKDSGISIILRIIEKYRILLLGQIHYQIDVKTAIWQEIHKKAVRLGIVSPQKNWKYVKDNLWEKWKAVTMEKLIIDSEQCKAQMLRPLNECDQIICNILGLKIEPIVEISLVKEELDSEPDEQEDFEIISDEDVNLQSTSSSINSIKTPKIRFRLFPVPKTKELDSEMINDNNSESINGVKSPGTSNELFKTNLNSNQNKPTPQTGDSTEKVDTDSTVQFLTDTKNTHKMILENVRDIKMKLFMQKKPTHCEDCYSTNKEMLAVQNQILEVQQQNLKILQEIKNLSEHYFNKAGENSRSKTDHNEDSENNCNSESNYESNSDDDPLSNAHIRKKIKLK